MDLYQEDPVLLLLNVLDQWTEDIDNGSYVNVIYSNFMKVFDKMPHKCLLKFLSYCNLSEIIDWIKSYQKTESYI